MNLQSCCSPPLLPVPVHHPPRNNAHFHVFFPAKTKHHLFSVFPDSKYNVAAANSQVSSSPEEGRKLASELFDDELLGRVSATADAAEVLRLVSDELGGGGGIVNVSDCRLVMSAALDRGNADLALSVFYAMRSSFDPGWVENGTSVGRWKWSRPDLHTYTLLVKGLAASLRVSDALRMVDCVCRVGVSPGEEVPFGKVVRCPNCMIAVSVAQPQQGIQVVSCSKCRYQYELVSGNILTIESEEIRISY